MDVFTVSQCYRVNKNKGVVVRIIMNILSNSLLTASTEFKRKISILESKLGDEFTLEPVNNSSVAYNIDYTGISLSKHWSRIYDELTTLYGECNR